MWYDKLKEIGVSIHVITTGAGAGFQKRLWEIPGSSAYLSGASFPYDQDEQTELLGFTPESFCSEVSSVDLASAAYMKAYKFGGKNPVGIGLTASVASEKIHRGDHRVFATIITNDKVLSIHRLIDKGVGLQKRNFDGLLCDDLAFRMMADVLDIEIHNSQVIHLINDYKDNTDLALARFFERPFFASNGQRLSKMPVNKHQALMPGAYNPPHEGHFNAVQHVMDEYGRTVVFEITAQPPHKEALSVQELLKRAKLLHGYDRLFSRKEPLYLDKAKAMPGVPLVLGADAMVRMLDPKWGVDLKQMFMEFQKLDTKLLIAGRTIGEKFVTCDDISKDLRLKDPHAWGYAQSVMLPLEGRYDISSTEIRNKLRKQ